MGEQLVDVLLGLGVFDGHELDHALPGVFFLQLVCDAFRKIFLEKRELVRACVEVRLRIDKRDDRKADVARLADLSLGVDDLFDGENQMRIRWQLNVAEVEEAIRELDTSLAAGPVDVIDQLDFVVARRFVVEADYCRLRSGGVDTKDNLVEAGVGRLEERVKRDAEADNVVVGEEEARVDECEVALVVEALSETHLRGR